MESSFLNTSLPRPADKAGGCIRLRKRLQLAVQPTVEPVAKAQLVRPLTAVRNQDRGPRFGDSESFRGASA